MAKGLRTNAIIYLIANMGNASVPFLLLPILTRVLSPSDYGTIAMFIVVLGVLAAFVGLSVHGAVNVRYFQLSEEDMADFVSTCLVIVGISTLILMGLTWVITPYLMDTTQLPRPWLTVAVLAAAGQIIGLIRLALWQVTTRPVSYGSFQISQTLANALISLYLVLVVGLGWQGRLIGQSGALIGFGAIGLILLWANGRVVWPNNFQRHAKDALGFGVPLIPHILGGLLIMTIDRIIIVNLLGLPSAGIYMVAMQVGQVLGLLADSFNKAYAPWLMRQLAQRDTIERGKIVKGTYLYFVTIFGIATLMAFGAPEIVDLVAGDAFKDAKDIVRYVVFGFAFSGCYMMVTNYIFFERKTALLAGVTFATGFLHLGLSYVLLRQNGLVGAGQAFVISQGIAFIATWILSHRVHPMPWQLPFVLKSKKSM